MGDWLPAPSLDHCTRPRCARTCCTRARCTHPLFLRVQGVTSSSSLMTMFKRLPFANALARRRRPKTAKKATPDAILELGFGFETSKILHVAVAMNLFTTLAKADDGKMTNNQVRIALRLIDTRRTADFLDALVSLQLLRKHGSDPDATYSNTPETLVFLSETQPERFIGRHVNVCDRHLYRQWTDHSLALKDRSIKLDDPLRWRELCHRAAHSPDEVRNKGTKVAADDIIKHAFAFWPSRVLLTAVELELFTWLEASESRALSLLQICEALKIRKTAAKDFVHSLVASNMLRLKDDGKGMRYSCTQETALFLDKRKPDYIGGILVMNSQRYYRFFADLGDALQTGMMQNEAKETGWQVWPEQLYSSPQQLKEYLYAKSSLSSRSVQLLCKTFDFGRYTSLLDVDGGLGQSACRLAQTHPQLHCVTTADRIEIEAIAQAWIAEQENLTDRVSTLVLNYHRRAAKPFPNADVIVLAHVLQEGNLATKKMLIKKAYDALPVGGGVLIVLETLIDNDRQFASHALGRSLLLLIEFGNDGGFCFTGADYEDWCREIGFGRIEIQPLVGSTFVAIAYKEVHA